MTGSGDVERQGIELEESVRRPGWWVGLLWHRGQLLQVAFGKRPMEVRMELMMWAMRFERDVESQRTGVL